MIKRVTSEDEKRDRENRAWALYGIIVGILCGIFITFLVEFIKDFYTIPIEYKLGMVLVSGYMIFLIFKNFKKLSIDPNIFR